MTREDEIKAAILHCFKGPEYEVECDGYRYRLNHGWEIWAYSKGGLWENVSPIWMNIQRTYSPIKLISPPPKKLTHAEWVEENLPYDIEELCSDDQRKFFTDLLKRATGEK